MKRQMIHRLSQFSRAIRIESNQTRRKASVLVLSVLLISANSATTSAQGPKPVDSPAPSVAPPRATVRFEGELRARSERDAPGGVVTPDLFTYLRTRFGAQIDTDAGVHLVLQAQDSRVLGAEGHPAAATVQEFGLHQAYVELRGTLGRVPIALRAGRQEIVIGNERLIGAVGWSNIGRSFDGARVSISNSGAASGNDRWNATAFAATVEERGRRFGGNATAAQHDHALMGIAASSVLPRGTRVEATTMYDVGGNYREFDSANRVTFDVRLRTVLRGRLSAELEAAWQQGHQRDGADSTNVHAQNIRAGMTGLRVGTFTNAAHRTSLFVGADVLSGDSRAHDGTYNAFSTMYGSNHAFYGLMDAIGDPAASTHERGLVDVLANGSLTVNSRVSARVEGHRFAMASGSGRDLGWEGDIVALFRILPTATADLGYSLFRAGQHASSIGLGNRGATRDWAFLQLRVGF